MLVVNKGKDNLILTDYNGKRYAFHKDMPIEISPEVYNSIILSGHISATDIVPVLEKQEEEKPAETIVEKVVEKVKDIGKKKGKGRK